MALVRNGWRPCEKGIQTHRQMCAQNTREIWSCRHRRGTLELDGATPSCTAGTPPATPQFVLLAPRRRENRFLGVTRTRLSKLSSVHNGRSCPHISGGQESEIETLSGQGRILPASSILVTPGLRPHHCDVRLCPPVACRSPATGSRAPQSSTTSAFLPTASAKTLFLKKITFRHGRRHEF